MRKTGRWCIILSSSLCPHHPHHRRCCHHYQHQHHHRVTIVVVLVIVDDKTLFNFCCRQQNFVCSYLQRKITGNERGTLRLLFGRCCWWCCSLHPHLWSLICCRFCTYYWIFVLLFFLGGSKVISSFSLNEMLRTCFAGERKISNLYKIFVTKFTYEINWVLFWDVSLHLLVFNLIFQFFLFVAKNCIFGIWVIQH